jgi:hypothetical protein
MTGKAKAIPLRRCVVCRSSRPQAELFRFYQDAAGHWQLDLTRRGGGRGSWLCRDSHCHQAKALKRYFRQDAEAIARLLSTQQGAKVPLGG